MFASSDKISLRAVEPADAALMYAWENDQNVWVHGDNLLPYALFEIEQFILEGHDFYRNRQARFMIDYQTNGSKETVGMADLFDFHPHHRRAGVGIYVAPAFRHRGIAKTAIGLLKEYAFETLELHQIYCHVLAENNISLKLFESAGFEKTAVMKAWIFRNGDFHDQVLMQLFNPKHKEP
ncbi:MAG: GNAT family N-acetyltransferase [Bacteroidetes bacterium]|nr:GNAT family N-acetyltransferase [Bacteroidota bacterium]